jgi:hypothetical protein
LIGTSFSASLVNCTGTPTVTWSSSQANVGNCSGTSCSGSMGAGQSGGTLTATISGGASHTWGLLPE